VVVVQDGVLLLVLVLVPVVPPGLAPVLAAASAAAGVPAAAPPARRDDRKARVRPAVPGPPAARGAPLALLLVLLFVLLTDRIHASGNRLVPLVCPVDGCRLSHGS
jgi:hypothetical protein